MTSQMEILMASKRHRHSCGHLSGIQCLYYNVTIWQRLESSTTPGLYAASLCIPILQFLP